MLNFLVSLKDKYFVLVWLLFLCGSVTAFVYDGLSTFAVLSLMLSGILQACVYQYLRILDAIQPLRKINFRAKKSFSVGHSRYTPILIAPTVCFAQAAPLFGGVYLFFFMAIFLPHGIFLCQSYIQRRRMVATCKSVYREDPPQVVLYASGMEGSEYQINQWLTVLESLDLKVAILIRKSYLISGIAPTQIDAFYARTHAEVEWLLSNGPRVVLYPANSMENAQSLRQYMLCHIFINHGESDKAVNQSKLLMAYDKIFVGGPLAERRLREAGLPLRDDQVVHVGRPQAEIFLERLDQKANRLSRVLYAPTWEGFGRNVDYSSIEHSGVELIQTLGSVDGLEIIFKPHPYTGSRSEKSKAALGRVLAACEGVNARVLSESDSLYEAMNWSDVLITDVSSVLTDYLITGKPVVICPPKHTDGSDVTELFPTAKAAYVFDKTIDVATLLQSIEAEDVLFDVRSQAREDALGSSVDSSVSRFSQAIERSLISCN